MEAGILHAYLGDGGAEGMASLRKHFPWSDLRHSEVSELSDLVGYLDDPGGPVPSFRIAVSGTPFQLEVWRALLTIPFGERVSYGQLAAMVGRPEAVRAVGTAVGRNPVAFLIPCHRVVHADGRVGQYMWGTERKRVMLGWEAGLKGRVV
jgi:AraC family transcriptional regulator of adaptative response/methylated-DNA-[protein]-cysteine methyltransferase